MSKPKTHDPQNVAEMRRALVKCHDIARIALRLPRDGSMDTEEVRPFALALLTKARLTQNAIFKVRRKHAKAIDARLAELGMMGTKPKEKDQ